MSHRPNYEDAPEYGASAYRVAGWGAGIAFYVRGWETEPDEDTEWTGIEERTGRLVVTMVGDDALHVVDPEEVTELGELEYCAGCGQIGCTADGRDRSEGGAE